MVINEINKVILNIFVHLRFSLAADIYDEKTHFLKNLRL